MKTRGLIVSPFLRLYKKHSGIFWGALRKHTIMANAKEVAYHHGESKSRRVREGAHTFNQDFMSVHSVERTAPRC